jgi:alpha-beta hydrolase superfamily lysophospholipase
MALEVFVRNGGRLGACSGAVAVTLALGVLWVDPAEAIADRVSFRTEDGVTIAASWYEPGARAAPAVILVHMLNKSRRDWEPLASRLAAEGIGALALDLRGHGDSTGSVDSRDYSALVRDVSAARRYLASRGDVQQTRVGVAGASIGANLAMLEAAGDTTVASLALLSPSVDYRGLRIESAAAKYGARPVLLVASDDDPYAARSVRDLQKAGHGTREALVLSHAGHGTVMLARDQDLARRIVEWFRRTLVNP